MAYDVFISYRRQGGGADARMMYDRLQSYGYTVSFDMDTLKNGNFNEELLKRVAECKNFVVLLSENCFERTLNGCKREDDWLRIEIATALYNNKNIVTVMLPGFVFPPKLPPDIDEIRNKNGPKYDLYYIDGFYDKLKKDFLIKGDDGDNGKAVTALEEIFSAQEEITPSEGTVDVVDLIGDDTDFIRGEVLGKYKSVSRLLPFAELETIDHVWNDAEKKKDEGDYKSANELYLKVLNLSANATPCASAFAMRMTADGIDTRQCDWFEKALARAQSGDVDYEYGVGTIYSGGLGVAKDPAAAFRWFERAARNGNQQAMVAVGAAYSIGCGVETDYLAAKKWLAKPANEGLPVAQERMGYLYQNGFGVKRNLNKARDWYESAAKLGNSAARAALGGMYMNGDGVEKDMDRAMSWYREAAADDQPDALRMLAEHIFLGGNVVDGYEEALSYCRRAVNAGDCEAIVLLGRAYENGWGVEKDCKKAGELFEKAKQLGSKMAEERLRQMEPETQYRLGLKFMEGRGVAQDYTLARSWFSRAAEQEDVGAMVWLGHFLANGLGGDVDMKAAVELFEKAAQHNSAIALMEIGGLYRSGQFYKEDKGKALEYYCKAASLWNDTPEECRWLAVGCFTRMALMYKKGEACAKDELLAARLYRFAATSGKSIVACCNLGALYRDGIGVQKSKEKMEFWFSEMWRIAHESLHPCDGGAMCTLGDACQSGQGVSRDLMAASEWWHKGLAQNNFNSAVDLSNVGKQHPEVLRPDDKDKIIEQYKRKAAAGSRVAMYNLGIRYRLGRDVKADTAAAVEWYKKSAECGYGQAMLILGSMYENGDGVVQDKEEGLKWIVKAAEADSQPAQRRLADRYKGGTSLGRSLEKRIEWLNKVLEKEPEDVHAARQLGLSYRDGIGVNEDSARAKELFSSVIGKLTRLSEDQKAGSQDDLADCYYNGYGVERDIKRATELYEMAAKGKDAHAMMMLRNIYRFGANGNPDLDMSSRWAEAYLAEKTKEGGDATRGLPDSCFAVGNIYRHGYGVAPDSAVALAWYEKAADKKSWKAMLRLADLLRKGEGCKKNVGKAKEWEVKAIAELQPLADNGQAEAQRGLADCYVNAWGVERSYEKAVKLYSDAYECRDWLAFGRLSRLYAEGLGVVKDVDKARTMLQLAAEKEDPEACGRLGECYEYGELGIGKDYEKAVEWYRKSAVEGDACGLFNLGRCYMNGIGVELDHKAAIMWLELAAAEKGEYWGYDLKAVALLGEFNDKSKKGKKDAAKNHKSCKVGATKKRKDRSHA